MKKTVLLTICILLLATFMLAKSENFVLVEKGSFTMGDLLNVTLTYNFYIGKYEVTFDEYDAFCSATARVNPAIEGGEGEADLSST